MAAASGVPQATGADKIEEIRGGRPTHFSVFLSRLLSLADAELVRWNLSTALRAGRTHHLLF